MDHDQYIPVKRSNLDLYKNISLYYESGYKTHVLYKPAGRTLTARRINEGRHPKLYINREDRVAAIKELQKGFNNKLKNQIASTNTVAVKNTLCNLVEETFREPRSGALQVLPETIDILVSGYSEQPEIIKTLASISFKDYTTIVHSVNVMALTIGFCFYRNFSLKAIKKIGLSALLHDIGKIEIPLKILTAPRKLSKKEYSIMKSHTIIGSEIIKANNWFDDFVAVGALEHHEKLDGSGYPKAEPKISFIGQLLSIIDCYEALTNETRPYRRAKKPFNTLQLIQKDVAAGKFNKEIFEQFCYSLT